MAEKFSVLMSVYEKENPVYFKMSLESIINQTIIPNQIVLVKDGPITDDLDDVINEYKIKYENLIDVLALQENVGLATALNEGLKVCKHPLVARMDTDDIACPSRFEKLLDEFINNPSLDIVGSYVNDIDSKGEKLSTRKVPTQNKRIRELIWTCPIIHPSVMYKRNKINELGGYDQTLRRRQDYDLWYRAVKSNFVFANIPEPLLHYRIDDSLYLKKNNIRVQYQQLKIGLRGNKLNNLAFSSYLGVVFNFIYRIQPIFFQKFLNKYKTKFDPRKE